MLLVSTYVSLEGVSTLAPCGAVQLRLVLAQRFLAFWKFLHLDREEGRESIDDCLLCCSEIGGCDAGETCVVRQMCQCKHLGHKSTSGVNEILHEFGDVVGVVVLRYNELK